MRKSTFKGDFESRGQLLLAILDWVLLEQLAGRAPNSVDVAEQFKIPLEETELIHEELDAMGELDGGPP